MTLLNLSSGRNMTDDMADAVSEVENYIKNHSDQEFDSYLISQECEHVSQQNITKALLRLEKHGVIRPVVNSDGSVATRKTGSKGRPPRLFILADND